MVIFKWVCFLIAGVAPFAAIASLIGAFLGLGGWGWLLFLWFGFAGMFSMVAAEQFDSAPGYSAAMATLLLVALVAGAAFGLSDLPREGLKYPPIFDPLFA